MSPNRIIKRSDSATRRILFSIGLMILFFMGRNFPLPGFRLVRTEENVQLFLLVSGFSNRRSLFALGIGPWVTASILLQFAQLSGQEKPRKVSKEETEKKTDRLAAVIAVFQAFVMVLGFPEFSAFQKYADFALLLIGYFAVWGMAKANETKGFGGRMLFIVVNVMQNFILQITAELETWFQMLPKIQFYMRAAGLLLCAVILAAIVTFMERAEYRMQISRVAIHNDYAEKAYFPIKLNCVGMMPIMFSGALLSLFSAAAQLLQKILPNSTCVQNAAESLQLSTQRGVVVYTIMLFAMTILLAMLFISPQLYADRLERGGDVLEYRTPGEETRRHIRNRLLIIASLDGIFLVLFTCLPMFAARRYGPDWAMLNNIGSYFFMLGLISGLAEEAGYRYNIIRYKDLTK